MKHLCIIEGHILLCIKHSTISHYKKLLSKGEGKLWKNQRLKKLKD